MPSSTAIAEPTRLTDPTAIGLRLRERLGDWQLPLMAIQTVYSMHRGTGAPAAWSAALRALSLGREQRALIADRDDLAGLPDAIRSWGRERIAVGATVDLTIDADPDEQLAVFLAPDQEGYARLCQLLSWRHEHPDEWRLWAHGRHAGPSCAGLVALVQDVGWLRRLREADAEAYWRCDIEPVAPPPGIPAVAAPIIHHISQDGCRIEPLLSAIRRHQRAVTETPSGTSLLDLVRMRAAYHGHEAAIERGRELLARCSYVPGGVLHLPPSQHEKPQAQLRFLAEEGLRRRYGNPPSTAAIARLEDELAVINRKGFAGYVLTVHHLVQNRRTCGRGSGASSIVCYALGITNVCPLTYNLVFERFLSDDRVDPPDIDVDFAWDERDAVLKAAFDAYGRAHCAMVATHLRYRGDSAMRDAAKAYGMPDADISRVQQRLREFRRYGRAASFDEPWPTILTQARALHDCPRHYGLHPGGVVITAPPIRDLVPVHAAAKAIDGAPVPAIAWEKDGAEELGLVKIDLLGNRSLAVVRDCLKDLNEDGIAYDENRWQPEHDPATRRLVSAGRTVGCFYIESPAMRQLNAKAGDVDFDRLVAHSSVIRPAAHRWVNDYLERYHEHRRTGQHRAEWYPHPALRELLSETYGILAYQEDLMLVCQRLAGFDSAGANQVRKALGKRDTTERLQMLSSRFFAGCERNGVARAVADRLWSQSTSFSGYSFCKAHSASYAKVSFECAYFKTHHPAYFMAAVIANEGGFYTTRTYIEEARRLRVAIRGPCVLRSDVRTKSEGAGAIRIGLHLVPDLRRQAMDEIKANRPFHGVHDLVVKAKLTTRDLEALLYAGALDETLATLTFPQRCWLVRDVIKLMQDGRLSAQLNLFEGPSEPTPPDLPEVDARELEWQRFQRLGFCPRRHPLLLWDLPKRRWTSKDVCPANERRWIEIIGLQVTRKEVDARVRSEADSDSATEAMSFVTVEDEFGLVESVWFPEVYRRYGICLEDDVPMVMTGRIEVSFGVASLTVTRAEAFDANTKGG